MIGFGHTAVGTLVGLSTYSVFRENNPLVGLAFTSGAALISHYITDYIPHGHIIQTNVSKLKFAAVIFLDVIFSVLLFSLISYVKDGVSLKLLYVLFGIGGALLPDVSLWFVIRGYLPNKGIAKLDFKLQTLAHWHNPKKDVGLSWGTRDIWQITVIVCALLAITFI